MDATVWAFIYIVFAVCVDFGLRGAVMRIEWPWSWEIVSVCHQRMSRHPPDGFLRTWRLQLFCVITAKCAKQTNWQTPDHWFRFPFTLFMRFRLSCPVFFACDLICLLKSLHSQLCRTRSFSDDPTTAETMRRQPDEYSRSSHLAGM